MNKTFIIQNIYCSYDRKNVFINIFQRKLKDDYN